MGEGFMEMELGALLDELMGTEILPGTAAYGVAAKVAAEDMSTAGLSPAQLHVWEAHIWPAIGRLQARHQRLRFEE